MSNSNRPRDTRSTNEDGPGAKWSTRWEAVRSFLRKTHAQLTDDDLAYTEGREDDLYQRIGRRLGKSDQQARELVEDAARGQANNPQDRSTLRDQRDRTTGADQATRTDTMATDQDGHVTNSDEAHRITNADQNGLDGGQ